MDKLKKTWSQPVIQDSPFSSRDYSLEILEVWILPRKKTRIAFNRDGDFADFYFERFQSSAFLQISAVLSFQHSNQRERKVREKMLTK